jgi:hypothetical protein
MLDTRAERFSYGPPSETLQIYPSGYHERGSQKFRPMADGEPRLVIDHSARSAHARAGPRRLSRRRRDWG